VEEVNKYQLCATEDQPLTEPIVVGAILSNFFKQWLLEGKMDFSPLLQ
jgi:hypothetical protein